MKLRAETVKVCTTFPMHARIERELLQRHLIEGVQTPVIKGDHL